MHHFRLSRVSNFLLQVIAHERGEISTEELYEQASKKSYVASIIVLIPGLDLHFRVSLLLNFVIYEVPTGFTAWQA
jgi:hypothetical protein